MTVQEENENVMESTKCEFNNGREFEIRSGIDLIDQYKKLPEPKVVWNGIIEGSCGLIVGVGKTGKTTFAENLAMAFAVGKHEFYGYELNGEPKKVLFFNLEEKLWRIGRRNVMQTAEFNEKESHLFSTNYFTAPDGFPEYLLTDEDWSDLNTYITKVDPDILFMDSLTHMCIGEIERSSIAQDFTQKFKKYISSLNITTFIIHHNTKGNDKPMTQDNIAGSRIITQEFDFALGLGNVPTARGGTYSCMLYNKDAIKDNMTAELYEFDANYRVKKLDKVNINSLYQETKQDGRISTHNKDLVHDYILSKASQGSQTISSTDLQKQFVESSTFSRQTLFSTIGALVKDGNLERLEKGKKGKYNIVFENNKNENAEGANNK